ncbi:MAG: glucokinase [Acidobacteria bacterium]|nr:glucokinase [Acidobacteriota bacterium]
MILAGDVGGTKTRLALVRAGAGPPALVSESTFPSRDYPGIEPIVREFVSAHPEPVAAACLGVPGPVRDGRCLTTTLAWEVDARDLGRVLNLPAVDLINDLEASAHGIAGLAPKDLLLVYPGSPGAAGNAALISPGTGLGEAGLFWDGRRHRPFACEGGHASFAPRGDLQIDLLRYLYRRFDHVSWERIVSGPGLVSLYRFLRDTGRGEEPEWLAEEMGRDDPAAAISAAALEGRSVLCERALELFVELLAAEAGNLALKVMATGGVYLGGGIVPRIAAWLTRPIFLQAFTAAGRMRPLLEAMPVRAILNQKVAILGAALYTLRDRGPVIP